LFGVPFLSWSLMCNHVVLAQGRARSAMINSLLPTIVNTTLNPIFINTLHMGIEGSAWATLIGYVLNCVLVTIFLRSGRNEVRVRRSDIRIDLPILREITAIGGTVLLEVFAGNLFTIVLNRIIFQYEREAGVVIAGIVQRMTLLFLIPFIAIDSGLRPIIGYNFGNGQKERIRQAIIVAIRSGAIICYLLFGLMVFLSDSIASLFTTDAGIREKVSLALRIIFLFFPLGILPIVTSIYFQAIARPKLAFCLTLLRSFLLLIPLLYLFSYAFGYNGILWTFPVVDLLTALTAFWLLRKEMNLKLFNMKTSFEEKTKTGKSSVRSVPAPPQVFGKKRALIGKKFVSGSSSALILLLSILFIITHVLLMQGIPILAIVLIEFVLFLLVWNQLYQVVYDLKMLFFRKDQYDSRVQYPAGMEYPPIAFIIPSFQEPFSVAKMTFDSVVRAPYPGVKEIIVVDNSPNTLAKDFVSMRQYVETFADLHPGVTNVVTRFIYNPRRDTLKPGNLDLAEQFIELGEFVVILDVDSTLPGHGNLLEKAVAEFLSDGKLGFLQFHIKATNNHFNPLSQAIAASQDMHRLRLTLRSYGGYKIFEGHNGMWRRAVLDRVGPWTDYYKDNIMITEDILKSAQVYANGYYGKSLNIETGEWVPASLDALESMWMRWTYGTIQVLFKCYDCIYTRRLSAEEKFDITYHVLNHILRGFCLPVALLLTLFTPGAAAGLFIVVVFVLPQLTGAICSYRISVSRLNLSVRQRLWHVYCGFFIVDIFIMTTQLQSTLNYLAGIRQGWKVTAKGVENSSGWGRILGSKAFHIGAGLLALGSGLFTWVFHYHLEPTGLPFVVLPVFIGINLLMCIFLFGKERQTADNDAASAIIDVTQTEDLEIYELKADVT
jgi:O-antigen/teichoic acid export membrane protein